MTQIQFTLNGSARSVDVRTGESLLETLRTRCGVLSTKDGCQPQGQCGCCLALVDGKPKVTCAVPAERARGAHIVTLEGLPSEERELIGKCFSAAA
ncbi:MAG: 2Fe-2S iron-sulfur cluster-binding protein, partial [Thermoanaerobaculia bacterium]